MQTKTKNKNFKIKKLINFAVVIIICTLLISLLTYVVFKGKSCLWPMIKFLFGSSKFEVYSKALFPEIIGILLVGILIHLYKKLNKRAIWRKRLPVITLGIFSLYLGWLGILAKASFQMNYSDSIYQALSLFYFASDVAKSEVPLLLNIARFATLVTTVAAILMIFAGRFMNWVEVKLLYKNHVIICGLGTKGYRMAFDFLQKGFKVVALEINENNNEIETIRSKGGIVFIGNATDIELLKDAGIGNAQYLIAVTGNDETNIDIASKVYGEERFRKIELFVHVEDLDKQRIFKRHELFSAIHDNFDARIFNVYDLIARIVLNNNAPDKILLEEKRFLRQESVTIYLAGEGTLALSMLQQIARVSHYSNLKKTKVRVITEENCYLEGKIDEQLPALKEIVNLSYCTLTETEELQDYEKRKHYDNAAVLFVCFNDEILGFKFLLKLIQSKLDKIVKIIICIPQQTSLTEMLSKNKVLQNEEFINISFYPVLEEACKAEVLIHSSHDELAKRFHEYYLSLAPNSPNAKGWEEIDEEIRDSNRHLADHWAIKKRAIINLGSGITDKKELDPQLVTLLAEMEHNRWCAEKKLAGFKYGVNREEPRRIHPLLKEWNQFDDVTKKKNEEQINKWFQLV